MPFQPTRTFLVDFIEKLSRILDYRFSISGTILEHICDRYERDILRYPFADTYKQSSIICYWIKELKPIMMVMDPDVEEASINVHVNEILAFVIGLSIIGVHHTLDLQTTQRSFNNIIHSLRYRNLSQRPMILIYQMLHLD